MIKIAFALAAAGAVLMTARCLSAPFRPRPKTSRWPKASTSRSGATATIGTVADEMIQMSPSASAQAASPWVHGKTAGR